MPRMVTLQVYVSEDCWACAESRRIVADIKPQYPQVAVEMLDVALVEQPEAVFAVPTYVLDGRIISLGNPHRADLHQKLQAAIGRVDIARKR